MSINTPLRLTGLILAFILLNSLISYSQTDVDAGTFVDRHAVGTIIYSVLPPTNTGYFKYHDPEKWRLMDDKVNDGFTDLKALVGNLPDARAMFVRGQNFGREGNTADPDGERAISSEQPEGTQQHIHKLEFNLTSNHSATAHQHYMMGNGPLSGTRPFTEGGTNGNSGVQNEAHRNYALHEFHTSTHDGINHIRGIRNPVMAATSDEFPKHYHNIPVDKNTKDGQSNGLIRETRPNNIALYIYVKVNE